MLGAVPMPSPRAEGKALPSSKLAPLLFGLFAVLTAAIGVVSWRFHVAQSEALERGVQTQLLTIADTKVSQIIESRKVRLGEARTIMADTLAMAALERVITGKATESDREAAAGHLRSICANLRYSGAVLVDPAGQPVMWEGRKFGDAAYLQSLMQRVSDTGDIVERDFDAAESPGAAHLGLNLPLRAGAGRPIFGGLLLSIDPKDYLYPIQRWPVPSRSGEVLLVRREGDSVVCLNSARGLPGTSHPRIPLARGDVAAVMAVQGREGNVEAVDYLGVPIFAALRPVPDTAWFLIAKMDSDEVGEPIRRRSMLLGVTAISLILTAGALVLILWRREQLRVYRERYESEIAHRNLVEQYNNLSRFANDVILLLDSDSNIVTANDRAADVYGYSLEQLQGMNVGQLRAPSSRQSLSAEWALAKERGSLIFETVHLRRDGREFAVEVSTRGIVVEGRSFQQSIIRDISDRKHAEQELSASESRFRELVENSPYGILVADGMLITYANPEAERMFGAPKPGDLVGRSLLERVPADEVENLQRRWRNLAAGGPSPMVERRYLRMSGEEFWVALTAVAMQIDKRPAGL